MSNLSKKYLTIIIIAIFFGIPALGIISSTVNNGSTTHKSTSTSMIAPAHDEFVFIAEEDGDMEVMGAPAGRSKRTNSQDMMISEPGLPFPAPDQGFTPNIDRVVVKNANISLLVEDTRQAVTEISTITGNNQGSVSNSSINENQHRPGQVSANMTLRVPVDSVDTVITALREVATKVTSENISAQDRTEQKIDLDAQLKNLRATEAQLQTIMTRAGTIEETLQVQNQLTSTRSQIERLQARLDNLLGDAAMSTIQVSISTEAADLPILEDSNRSIWQEVKLATRETVAIYRQLFINGVRLIILAGPILVIGSISVLAWKKLKKNS
jgi:hypothetical protein